MNFVKTTGAVVTALFSVFATESSADSAVALFPYTVVGRAVDSENVAFDAGSGVLIKIADTNGTVLAQSKVFTPGTFSPWNFRLVVPVASGPVRGYAVAGDTLEMSAVRNGVVYSGLLRGDASKVSSPGANVEIRVMLSEDSDGNGIGDDYEKTMASLMAAYGVPGPYDPDADYDGDGASNRNEYLAGTNPFDAGDRFGAASLTSAAEDPRYLKMTFETNAGRTYALKESGEIAADAAEWKQGTFKEDPASDKVSVRLVNPRDVWELRTVYLLKQGEKRFYRLELEE